MKAISSPTIKVLFSLLPILLVFSTINAQKVLEVYPKAIKADGNQIYYRWPGIDNYAASSVGYSGENEETSAYRFDIDARLYRAGETTYWAGIYVRTVSIDNSRGQELAPGPVTITMEDTENNNWLPVNFTLLPDSAAATFNRTDIQQNWSGGRLDIMTMSDLDGDGYEDIVAYAHEPQRVLWRKNNGNKTWSSIQTIDTWSGNFTEARGITSGDLDADGDNDIILAYKGFVSVYKNSGSGTFGTRIDYTIPRVYQASFGNLTVRHIDLHDMNRDGLLDVLYNAVDWNGGGSYNRTIGYLPIQSNGSLGSNVILFEEATTNATNNNYKGVSAGGRDRYILIVPTPSPNYGIKSDHLGIENYTQENSYRGSFLTDWNQDGEVEATDYEHTIDVDADGDMDAFTISGQIYYRENMSGDGSSLSNASIGSTGTCNSCNSSSYLDLEVSDYDHDGDMDVIAINQRGFYVFENIWKGNSLLSVSNPDFTSNTKKEGNTFTFEVDSTISLVDIDIDYTISGGAAVVLSTTDFSNPVTFTITSEEGIAADWVVNIVKVPSTVVPIYDFSNSSLVGKWQKEKYAAQYRIEATNLTSSGTTQNITIDATESDSVSYDFSDLLQINHNTNYRIRITAINEFGSLSNVFSEDIQTPPQAPSSLSLIAASVTQNQFEINWVKGSSTAADRVRIYEGATLTLDSVLSSDKNTFKAIDLEPTSYYTVEVAAINEQKRESNRIALTDIVTGPLAPTLGQIDLNNIFNDSILISWDAPTSGAESYGLSIDNKNDVNIAGKTSYLYKGFAPGKTILIKVRAQNISNSGTSNDTYSDYSAEVEVLSRPAPPTLSSFGASDITGTSFVASWNPVESATSYGTEVSSDDFITIAAEVTDITTTNAQLTGLAGGTNYNYRVVAYNASGSSKYSLTGQVLTAPPNPILGELTEITSNTAKVRWDAVDGANGYLVDVSNTDFITFVSGFNQKNTVATEMNITNLQPGTDYKVRVTAYNASATSGYSDSLSFITIPAQPFNLSTSNITLTSARCSWNNPGGASSFDFQLSTSQSFIDTLFESKAASTNIDLTDLAQRTIYYFRVRASNESGSSAFIASNFETDGEENIAPTGLNLSNRTIDENLAIGTFVGKLTTSDANSIESFTYTFEGSGNDNGSFTIVGDSLYTNTALNFESKNSYQLAIRTTDSGGLFYSGSLEITIRDINDTPMNLQLSNNTIVAFSAANTAIGQLSVTDEDTGDSHTFSLDTGTDAFTINGVNLQNKVVFTNEEDSTIQIVLRASDSKDAFITASLEIVVARYIDTDAPVLSNLSETDEFVFGSAPITLTIDVSDFRVSQVEFFTRSITATDFEATDVSSQSGTYSFTVNEADLDGVGLVFFVRAEDQAGNVAETEERTISLTFPESSSPEISSITRFGGKVEDYEIIAIPFNFPGTGNRVQEIFNEYNGGIPDKTIWRLIKYNASTETEESNLEDLVASSPIQIGAGYFFNAREAAEVKVGAAEVNTEDPQDIVLQPGWNLIGNPYIIDIDWNSVLARNGIAEVGPLRVIDPADPARWPESTLLSKYKGAFVNLMSTTAQTITFSYADKIKPDGRISTPELPDYEWFVPISLHQENHSGLASVGMHARATTGVDALDALTLPKWIRYLEISFDHPEFRYGDLSKDIVPPSEKYSWKFNATSDQNGPTTLRWDHIAANIQSLKLLDISNQVMIDMSVQTAYTFSLNGTKRFKILYSTDPSEQFLSEQVNIGEAYPNPFDVQLTIPIALPVNSSSYDVTLITTDLAGREVWRWTNKEMPAGNHQLIMKRTAAMSTGVYFYQLSIKSADIDLEFTNKIIIK